MPFRYLIAAIIGVSVAAGAYWAFESRSSVSADNAASTPENTETVDTISKESAVVGPDGAFEGSIFTLANSGESYKCTVQTTAQGVTVNGTVYVADRNIRGDFSAKVPVIGAVEAHMIADDTTVYAWTSVLPKGYTFIRTENGAEGSKTIAGQTFDFNQSYSYDCVESTVDSSMFTVPSNITFTAYTQQ